MIHKDNRMSDSSNPARLRDRTVGEFEKFSTDHALLTQQHCAAPSYQLLVRGNLNSPDPDHATTAPVSDARWSLRNFWGLHGYLDFDGGAGSTATLELWALNPEQNHWYRVAEVSNIGHRQEFHFAGQVRGRTVALRVAALNLGGATDVSIHCSAE